MTPLTRMDGRHFNTGEEQAFKMAMIAVLRSNSRGLYIFEIENEEKEPGFPDTLELHPMGICCDGTLVEYKVSDNSGYIEFEPKQPLFYKKNQALDIFVRAWSVPEQRAYQYRADEILEALTARIRAGHRGRRLSMVGGGRIV